MDGNVNSKSSGAVLLTAAIELTARTNKHQTLQIMTRNELKAIADNRRKYGNHPASDPTLMVLLLMETEEHASNYCSALREVMAAFPEVNRDELETELDRFI